MALFYIFLFCDRPFLHVCNLVENLFSTLILGSVFNDYVVFYRDIYISPDINGLIVGLDWLRRQGRIEWDFTDDRIQRGNGGWLKLHDDAKSRRRQIYATMPM